MIKVISTEAGIQLQSEIQLSPIQHETLLKEKDLNERASKMRHHLGLDRITIDNDHSSITARNIGMSGTFYFLSDQAKDLHDKHVAWVHEVEKLSSEYIARHKDDAREAEQEKPCPDDEPTDEELDKAADELLAGIFNSIFDSSIIVICPKKQK